jgi:hypothetical protein
MDIVDNTINVIQHNNDHIFRDETKILGQSIKSIELNFHAENNKLVKFIKTRDALTNKLNHILTMSIRAKDPRTTTPHLIQQYAHTLSKQYNLDQLITQIDAQKKIVDDIFEKGKNELNYFDMRNVGLTFGGKRKTNKRKTNKRKTNTHRKS